MASLPLRTHKDVLRERLPVAGRRILDVGCGDGSLLRLFARDGGQPVGLDPQFAQIRRALAADAVGPERYVVGLGQSLPFSEASFDTVIFFNALHHVPVEVMDAALDEARRVLKPDGSLAVLEPVAAGPLFTLMQPLEDETEVRAEAEAAMARQEKSGALARSGQEHYETAVLYGSFPEWCERTIAVDPKRAVLVDRQRGDLERRFAELSERQEDGRLLFRQPARLDLFARA